MLGSGDEGYRQITRDGTWDASKAFENSGAMIFGDPTPGNKFAFVFAGHHLTIRCDGDSEPGAAFGGPIYYGHSPNGYSKDNLFNYQTKSVKKLFAALDEKQRNSAVEQAQPEPVGYNRRRRGAGHRTIRRIPARSPSRRPAVPRTATVG